MKKWSKLVLATMLSAGTLLVSGCIENLEPEGIADLRGAKAELLRAQTALQAAQAAKVEAEAALVLAQAKVQEAIAKQEEAKVAYFEAQALAEQYRAELLNIQNEEARADLEKKIADMEAAMEDAENKALIAAEKFKVEMLEVLKTLAQAQLAYDQALLDIELARNTLTNEQDAYLSSRLTTFLTLKADVMTMTRDLEDAAEELAEALAAVDEAEARDIQVRQQQRKIAKLQAELEGLVEAQAETEELMNLDPDITDWDAEKEALEEEIEALEKELAVLKREANDKYDEVAAGIQEVLEKAELYSGITGYDFDFDNSTDPSDPETWGTGLFSKIPGTYAGPRQSIDLPDVYVAAPLDDEGYPIFGFRDFKMIDNSYTYGDEESFIDQFENRILALSTYNTDAYQEQIDNLNDLIEAAQADWNYKIPMTRYEDAVAAYKAGDYLPYFNKYVFTQYNGYAADFSLEELVADYNESLVDLDAAIEEYESVIEKYDVDLTEDYAALLATQNEENAAADLAKVKAYQEAKDKFHAAEVIYEKAHTAYLNAQADYNRKIAIYTQDASYTDMKSYIDDYDQYVSAGGDPATANDPNYDTATYNKYKSNVASYDAAQKAFDDVVDPTNENDAQSVWDKADDVYTKASNEYSDALSQADQTHNAAYAAAQLKYDNAYRELGVSAPEIDYGYLNNLNNTVTNARTAVGTAMSALVSQLEYKYRDYESGENADIVVAEGTTHELSLRVWGVPSYLRKDVYDSGTNTVKYELIPADLKTIQDADYFLEVITDLADSFVYVDETYEVYAYEQVNWNFTWTYATLHYLGEYAGYPLVLPDYEVFVEDYEANIEPEKQRVWQDAYDILASSGYDAPGWVTTYSGSAGTLAKVYLMKMEIAELEAQMKNIALVPDFIKAIEAAKAEVEKFMEDKAAELDAIKKEVEETVPPVIEEMKALKAEGDALTAKNTVLTNKKGTLLTLINTFCAKIDQNATDLETLVEALEKAYNDAVDAVALKEDDIIEAENDLQNILDGLVDAVTIAQRNYDDTLAMLEMYQEFLDKATEELEKAIELIYGDEELPEDPAPENPAPEDPGTGDEGGEEETPAA